MSKKHHYKNNYQLAHKKELGQNFIEDEALLNELVALTDITNEDTVFEIGAGAGALTKKLLEAAKQVVCVEVDERLIPFLKLMEERDENLTLYQGDILALDPQRVLAPFTSTNIKVAANIPYYITSDIIDYLLKHRQLFTSIYLMIQKEVGEKIMAGPNEKDYGPLSILCQFYARPRILKVVPAAWFVPAPKVDSVFIALPLKKKNDFTQDEIDREGIFLKVVKSAFLMRRKTLVNNLQAYFSLTKDQAREILAQSGIKEKARGEECSIDDFMNIAKAIDQRALQSQG